MSKTVHARKISRLVRDLHLSGKLTTRVWVCHYRDFVGGTRKSRFAKRRKPTKRGFGVLSVGKLRILRRNQDGPKRF
eukprot:1866293-Rhodomonas_salina.1